MGGTTSLVAALVSLLEELDVDLRLDAPVSAIVVRQGRARSIRTESGERIDCDIVVSNADPTQVYSRLIAPEHLSRHGPRSVARVRQSMSLFVAYFGATRQYPEIAHHTIVMGSRYRDLLDDVFKRRVLADDFSLYLHAPTRTDPSLAPPGHEGFYVLSPVPNNLSGIDWKRQREPYFARIVTELEARLLPGLGDALVSASFMTPYDFEHTLRSADGCAFGPEPILTQSAYFRYHNRSPDVEGLYFVGAGTHPGGGVPGVLCSAKVLERVVPKPADGTPMPRRAVASAAVHA